MIQSVTAKRIGEIIEAKGLKRRAVAKALDVPVGELFEGN